MLVNHKQKSTQGFPTGTKNRLVLQKRDLWLFNALSLLRIMDRRQAALIAGFNSTTRTNERLLKLRRKGLLKRFFFVSAAGGKRAIYCLSKKGAELIGVPANAIQRPSDSFLIGDKFVAHQLAVNEVYCAIQTGFGNMRLSFRIKKFSKPISENIPLIPDAYIYINLDLKDHPVFLEVDLGTEALSVWNKKIEGYLKLAASGEFERIFLQPRFAVLVVTDSEKRMLSLKSHIRKSTSKIFYFTTLENIIKQGFWSAVWLRPEGEQVQSLI